MTFRQPRHSTSRSFEESMTATVAGAYLATVQSSQSSRWLLDLTIPQSSHSRRRLVIRGDGKSIALRYGGGAAYLSQFYPTVDLATTSGSIQNVFITTGWLHDHAGRPAVHVDARRSAELQGSHGYGRLAGDAAGAERLVQLENQRKRLLVSPLIVVRRYDPFPSGSSRAARDGVARLCNVRILRSRCDHAANRLRRL